MSGQSSAAPKREALREGEIRQPSRTIARWENFESIIKGVLEKEITIKINGVLRRADDVP